MPSSALRGIVLLGLESRYGSEVVDILEASGIEIAASIRSDHDREIAGDFPRLTPKGAIDCRGLALVVPLLTPGRAKLRIEEGLAMSMTPAPPCIHPSAVISPSARLGPGAIVGAMAVIGANVSAGLRVVANRAASVGHDCRLGDHCTIGPAATLCGAISLGDGAYVGAGAVLLPHVRVGRNAVIGAGAVVTRDVADGCVVAGNPARTLREGVRGYRDTGV